MTHRLHKGKVKRSDIPTQVVLKAVQRCNEGQEAANPHEVLMAEYGCHWKVAWAALGRELDRGYLDYGMTLRLPWLTPEGRDKLKELEAADGSSSD